MPTALANNDHLEPAVVEGEISGTGAAGDPTQNFDAEMMDSDEEGSDDDMQYSPASPGTPTTPMSVQHLSDPPRTKPRRTTETSVLPDERRPRLPREWSTTIPEVDDDLGPMLNLLEQEELLSQELQQCAAETVRLIAALGGQRAAYHRERKQAVQRMVAEVYSAPRVTKVAKLLPSLRILAGFAFDMSGTDDECQN